MISRSFINTLAVLTLISLVEFYGIIFQFMAMSFLLSLCWVVILGVATIPVFLYIMLGSFCNHEVYGNSFENVDRCFELRNFGESFLLWSILSCFYFASYDLYLA